MEEVLKGLKGKKLTKKTLFDFLSEINLNELYGKKDVNVNEIKVKEVIDIVDYKKEPEQLYCGACKKSFATKSSLKRHHDRHKVCKDWIELPQKTDVELENGLHHIIDDLLQRAISVDEDTECRYCNAKFSNRGNHHKHYITSAVCNKMAFQEFKRLINSV